MQGPRWIKQWIADLALLNEQFRNDDGSVDFNALGREEYAFRTALITQKLEKSERARETFMKAKAACDASSENGKKGGRPPKNRDNSGEDEQRTGGNSLPPVRNSKPLPMPNDMQTVIDFAYAEGLDINDAYECWYCTINDRKGKDADGNPVKNWKAYVRQWCRTREHNRRTA